MNILPGIESIQNIHPLFVHFPIALVLVTLLFEVLWWLNKKESFRQTATYLLYLSAVAAIAAVITGYIASSGLGHDAPGHDFVHEHRDLMYWMTGLLVATTLLVLFVRSLRVGKARRFLILPLLLVSGLLMLGADKGGRLVFEFGMGVKTTSEQSGHQEEGEETTGERSPDSHQEKALPDSASKGHDDGHSH